MSARLSRVKSSTIARMRKRRPSVKLSDTKSSDQRSLDRSVAQSAPAPPMPACGRHACAPAASPPGRAGGSASGSCGSPLGLTTGASDGSRSDAAGRRAPECGAAQRRRLHDGRDSASMSDQRPSPGTPAARSPRAPRTPEPRPAVEQRASPLSAVDVLQNGDVQHRLGQQLLQLGVLILERLQPPGIRHLEAAELGLPLNGMDCSP